MISPFRGERLLKNLSGYQFFLVSILVVMLHFFKIKTMKNLIVTFLFVSMIFVFTGCKDGSPATVSKQKVMRKGWVIRVKPGKLEEYKELHAHVWPGVLKKLREVHVQNYTIFYRDGLLFSYLEYTGDDFDADMKKMAADSLTQEWWKLTDPCQQPVETAGEGVKWADMEEVFHMD